MKKTAKTLFMEMTGEMAKITPVNQLHRAELCYQITKEAYSRLDAFIQQYRFKDPDEEILYYKTIKPMFMKEHIYYTELYHLESLKPQKDKKSISQYFKEALRFNNQYFDRNITFYNYYRAERTHHDAYLFIKDATPSAMPPLGAVDGDSLITHSYSYKLARFQALEILNNYIRSELTKLNKATQHSHVHGSLTWTDTKVALTELIYALYAKGALNHGKADIQTIINSFQDCFQINLGNHSSAFHQNIRIRKKERAVYLLQLREYFESHMDEMDENPRFI